MIEKNNNMGTVNISLDVVATIAGGAAIECYGVVGMASQKKLKDGYYDLLRKENYCICSRCSRNRVEEIEDESCNWKII